MARGEPVAPAASSTSSSAVPDATSITPGELTAPLIVSKSVPAASPLPSERNQASPKRAIKAAWNDDLDAGGWRLGHDDGPGRRRGENRCNAHADEVAGAG